MGRNFDWMAVLSSYVDGSEIYKGHDVEKARRLAVTRGDKCTLYTLILNDEGAHLKIERHYGNGDIDSTESMEINSWEIKHLKTLVSLLE